MTKTLFDLTLAVSQRLGETHGFDKLNPGKAHEWTNARRKPGEPGFRLEKIT